MKIVAQRQGQAIQRAVCLRIAGMGTTGEGDLIHTGRLVPVYPLTEGLHQRQTRKMIRASSTCGGVQIPDFLPADVKEHCRLILCRRPSLRRNYPDNADLKDRARVRLAFDELFLLQLGVLSKKRDWQESQPGTPININEKLLDTFLQSLPFKLTPAQQKVLNEILGRYAETYSHVPPAARRSRRGKTVVATAALLLAVADGYQTGSWRPRKYWLNSTLPRIHKLLSAVGHLETEATILTPIPGIYRTSAIALLIGATGAKTKKENCTNVSPTVIDIIIGTHAIIQKEVGFQHLGFVVVEEQHRFGVAQPLYAAVRKGLNPHVWQ